MESHRTVLQPIQWNRLPSTGTVKPSLQLQYARGTAAHGVEAPRSPSPQPNSAWAGAKHHGSNLVPVLQGQDRGSMGRASATPLFEDDGERIARLTTEMERIQHELTELRASRGSQHESRASAATASRSVPHHGDEVDDRHRQSRDARRSTAIPPTLVLQLPTPDASGAAHESYTYHSIHHSPTAPTARPSGRHGHHCSTDGGSGGGLAMVSQPTQRYGIPLLGGLDLVAYMYDNFPLGMRPSTRRY
jgi:uncharacterized small protein (DUF1192 family)